MTILLIIVIIIVALIVIKKKKLSFGNNKEEDENATKKCGDCMAEIPLKAKKCQHCGTKQKLKEKIGIKHLLLLGVIVLIFTWLFSFGGNGGSSSSSTPRIEGSKAFVIAQNYVEIALKAPSTADFPTFDYTAQNLGNGKWKVVSYVDAQNSFGAQIRNDWSVVLIHKGGDWSYNTNWELEELILGGEVIYP